MSDLVFFNVTFSHKVSRVTLSLLLISLNLNVMNPAYAGTISNTASTSAYARAILGQSFTMPVGESGLLTSITVSGIRGRGASNVVCVQAKLYTDSSKTTLLQTSSNSVCDTDASGTETTGAAAVGSMNFGNMTLLSAGTEYFFELSRTSGNSQFWAHTRTVVPGGPYSGGRFFTDGVFFNDIDMGFTLIYENADSAAPTFTSSASFSAAENIATSANAATIKVSESATITISAGADAAVFNIITSDSVTAFIRFKASPDFEAPADVGGNNVYEITIRAVDAAANAGTQAMTITVTDVVDTSSFNSLALAGGLALANFRTNIQISANITVASRVTFRINNKRIPGCINVPTVGSSPNIIATCNWKPAQRGGLTLSATAIPTGAGISSATANAVNIRVGNRTGVR